LVIQAFFVYGTLQRTQLRGGLWPRQPIAVQPAIVRAELYDLGPYPAIQRGHDWVLGELWEFAIEDMPETSRVLDQIEGFDALGHENEYVRDELDAMFFDPTSNPITIPAWAYFCANPSRLKRARRMEPTFQWNGYNVAHWPDDQCRVPKSFDEE
jgi:gamma-glutamylcyclotransferase (GGCT)/AIG2-like uncharacterized protein YtfP